MTALFPKIKKVALGGNRFGIQGLKFSPKKPETPPQPQSQPEYPAGTSVELPDGRVAEVVESSPETSTVQNGKPSPETLPTADLKLAPGTKVRNLKRNSDPIGVISRGYADGSYQINGATWTAALAPFEFEVLAAQEAGNGSDRT